MTRDITSTPILESQAQNEIRNTQVENLVRRLVMEDWDGHQIEHLVAKARSEMAESRERNKSRPRKSPPNSLPSLVRLHNPLSQPEVPKRPTLSAVDQKWGRFFNELNEPTIALSRLLRGIANYIIAEYKPGGSLVLTPDKLWRFYTRYKLDDDTFPFQEIFSARENKTFRGLEFLFSDLRCQYHLTQERISSRPTVPSLTPTGFEDWMTLFIRAAPDLEARRLGLIVADLPIVADTTYSGGGDLAASSSQGKPERLPRQLSRHLFPDTPQEGPKRLLYSSLSEWAEVISSSSSSYSSQASSSRSNTSSSSSLPPPLTHTHVPVSSQRSARIADPPICNTARRYREERIRETPQHHHHYDNSRERRASASPPISPSTFIRSYYDPPRGRNTTKSPPYTSRSQSHSSEHDPRRRLGSNTNTTAATQQGKTPRRSREPSPQSSMIDGRRRHYSRRGGGKPYRGNSPVVVVDSRQSTERRRK